MKFVNHGRRSDFRSQVMASLRVEQKEAQLPFERKLPELFMHPIG